MDTALPHKFPFILYRNLAKANCTGNHVCTSCDAVAKTHQFSLEETTVSNFLTEMSQDSLWFSGRQSITVPTGATKG